MSASHLKPLFDRTETLIGLLALPWQQHAELQEFYEDAVSWDSGNFPGLNLRLLHR